MVWTLPLFFDREGGAWSFHVSSFFVFVVGLCVRERKTESLFRERKMRSAEKSRSYMGRYMMLLYYLMCCLQLMLLVQPYF